MTPFIEILVLELTMGELQRFCLFLCASKLDNQNALVIWKDILLLVVKKYTEGISRVGDEFVRGIQGYICVGSMND